MSLYSVKKRLLSSHSARQKGLTVLGVESATSLSVHKECLNLNRVLILDFSQLNVQQDTTLLRTKVTPLYFWLTEREPVLLND